MAKPLTLYKLIVLYMLDRVSFPMTNDQLSEFILTKGYTDYFKLQQCMSELLESELINCRTVHNNTYYTIEDSGREVCHYFLGKISPEIRDEIKEYLRENEYELREEVSVLADYYRTPEAEYVASCVVKEQGESMLELKLRVSTEEQANAICGCWRKKSSDVYSYLIRELLLEGSKKE